MFAQTIRGKVSDPKAVRAAVQRWMRDLGPTAKGWLGSTGGVTDGGDLFVLVRFDSEGSARFNSARPEQDNWWSEFSRLLDGEVIFKDSNNLLVETNGDPDTAGFVQVIVGQSTDLERSRQVMTENLRGRQSAHPTSSAVSPWGTKTASSPPSSTSPTKQKLAKVNVRTSHPT